MIVSLPSDLARAERSGLFWLVLAHAALIPFFWEFSGLPLRLTTTDLLGAMVLAAWALSYRWDALRTVSRAPLFWPSVVLVATHWLALLGAEDLLGGLRETVKLTGIFAYYLVLVTWMRDVVDRRPIAWALVVGAVLVSVAAIGEVIADPVSWRAGHLRTTATTGQPNTLGGYLAGLIPVAWGLLWNELDGARRRFVLASLTATLFVMAMALMTTLSRGSWLGLIAAALGALWWLRRSRAAPRSYRPLAAVLALGPVVAAFLLTAVSSGLNSGAGGDSGSLAPAPASADSIVVQRVRSSVNWGLSGSDHERLVLLKAAWGMFRDHPVLGVGPGNYQLHLPQYTSFEQAWQHEFPHNVVLHVAAEAGIVGLMAFLWWLGSLLLMGYRSVFPPIGTVSGLRSPLAVGAFAGVGSVLVASLFGYPFVHVTWEPLVYCMALAFAPLSAVACRHSAGGSGIS